MDDLTRDGRRYIEERSIPIPFVGCWLWLRSCGSHGYGNACFPAGNVTTAQRVSFVAFRGAITLGRLVQHSCDNKWCVNPDHLSLGTDKSNARDRQTKGRDANVKIDHDIVRAIRSLSSAGQRQRQIAAIFGVDQRLVVKIVKGQSWAHVPGAHLTVSVLERYGEPHARALLMVAADKATRSDAWLRWCSWLAVGISLHRLSRMGALPLTGSLS